MPPGSWEFGNEVLQALRSNLRDDFRRTLPHFRPEDNVGSPYCVRRYVVDTHLGGPADLAIARQELAKRGA
jgi:hypothetical protein